MASIFFEMALMNSTVVDVPPRLCMRANPSESTSLSAVTIRSAVLVSSRYRSIITADSSSAGGLAFCYPVMSGAVQWTASNTATSSPKLAGGTSPSPPTGPAQRSDTMLSP